jgi:hypothetical protein
MTADPPKDRPVVRTDAPPKRLCLTRMFLAWHLDQPDFLYFEGLGWAIVLFSTEEKLHAARKEMPFDGTAIKVVTDQDEFVREIPNDIEIVVDPYYTPERKLRFTLIKRD